jgi:MFS transporter, DHA2 family, multidrug resistance protein
VWPRQQLAMQALANLREQQASSLAFFDTFWMAAVLTFAVTLVPGPYKSTTSR